MWRESESLQSSTDDSRVTTISDVCWANLTHLVVGLGLRQSSKEFKKSAFCLAFHHVTTLWVHGARSFLHRLHPFFFRLPSHGLLRTGRRWNCAAAMIGGGKRPNRGDRGTVPVACTWASSWSSAAISGSTGPCFDAF